MPFRGAPLAGLAVLGFALAACSSASQGLSTPSLPSVGAAAAAASGAAGGELSQYAPGVQVPPAAVAGFVISTQKLGDGFVAQTADDATTVAGNPAATLCGHSLGAVGIVQRYAVIFAVPNGGSPTVIQQTLLTYSTPAAAATALHEVAAEKSCSIPSPANRATRVTTTLSHFTAPGTVPGSLGLRRSTSSTGSTATVKAVPLVSLSVFQVKDNVLSVVQVGGGSSAQEVALTRRAAQLAGDALHAS